MSTQSRPAEYIELRCRADKSLMARIKEIPSGEIEIKCRRCKRKFKFNFPMPRKQPDETAEQRSDAPEMRAW
ncbi:MAG TPA: hypothetical protein VE262_21880 [Blastocatellia bacterium]|nr:hypothetical protein [Blastocatellia bacterium]